MFSNSYQSGFLSIFYSVGSNPLSLWDKHVKNGHIRRVVDDDVKSLVLEIAGTNVATTYITCPIQTRASLGVQLPFLVMVIKNMKRYFTFEIQILDDKDMRRRFRVSNFQSSTKVLPFCTTMPIGLSDGWNQVQFNLADFTKRAYGSTYMETTRVQIHANVRIRRIYFSDRLYTDNDMPTEFKLFAPAAKTKEPEKKRESIAKPAKEMVDEQTQRKSGEKTMEDLPLPTPVDDETKAQAQVAGPSPVVTAEALDRSEVDMIKQDVGGEEEAAPAPRDQETERGEAPVETEGAEEVPEGAAPEEGAEASAAEAPTEEGAEGAPTEGTGEEPAATTEPTTTEEPEATTTEEPGASEVATTEEPAAEPPSEAENEPPEE